MVLSKPNEPGYQEEVLSLSFILSAYPGPKVEKVLITA